MDRNDAPRRPTSSRPRAVIGTADRRSRHKILAEHFISHTLALEDILKAYDVFGRAAKTKALTVMINA